MTDDAFGKVLSALSTQLSRSEAHGRNNVVAVSDPRRVVTTPAPPSAAVHAAASGGVSSSRASTSG